MNLVAPRRKDSECDFNSSAFSFNVLALWRSSRSPLSPPSLLMSISRRRHQFHRQWLIWIRLCATPGSQSNAPKPISIKSGDRWLAGGCVCSLVLKTHSSYCSLTADATCCCRRPTLLLWLSFSLFFAWCLRSCINEVADLKSIGCHRVADSLFPARWVNSLTLRCFARTPFALIHLPLLTWSTNSFHFPSRPTFPRSHCLYLFSCKWKPIN